MKLKRKQIYRMLSALFAAALYSATTQSTGTVFFNASAAHAAEIHAEVDKPAPDFALLGSDGKEHQLASYRGKVVVLEWVNYECPFVKKHYLEPQRNMQTLQQYARDKGIVWLAISSSA